MLDIMKAESLLANRLEARRPNASFGLVATWRTRPCSAASSRSDCCGGHCNLHAKVCVFPPWADCSAASSETGMPTLDLARGAPPRPHGAVWRQGDRALLRWGEEARVLKVLANGNLELDAPETGVAELPPSRLANDPMQCVRNDGQIACDFVTTFMVGWSRLVRDSVGQLKQAASTSAAGSTRMNRSCVARWLAEARSGYCGEAEAGSSCDVDDKGSWTLTEAEASSWPSAVGRCTTRCAGCKRCQHLSISLQWKDCTWWHGECSLQSKVPGFRTAAAGCGGTLLRPPLAPPPSPPAHRHHALVRPLWQDVMDLPPSPPNHCLGMCADRGRCVRGFCICPRHSFGIDCAHDHRRRSAEPSSPSATGAGVMRAGPRGFAIYVYEVPVELGRLDWPKDVLTPDVFSSEYRFLHHLLRDGHVRTLDPEAADLFFVPMFIVGPGCDLIPACGGCPQVAGTCERARIELLTHYVRRHYPYWERSGGRDHIFWTTSDKGGCGLGHAASNAIIVSHWGLVGTWRKMQPRHRHHEDWADETRLAEQLRAGAMCFAPHKDVVVPTYWRDVADGRGSSDDSPLGDSEPPAPWEERETPRLLYFGGSIRANEPDDSYSGGVRQAVARLVESAANVTPARARLISRMVVRNTDGNRGISDAAYERAKFCLAVSGNGWGNRFMKSFLHNCVPLIIAPYVVQPFELQLPVDKMSLRLPYREIPQMAERLESMSTRWVVERRRRIRRARNAFVWGAHGLAYNHTLLALCQRAVELRGALKAVSRGCARMAAHLNTTAEAHTRTPEWFSPALSSAIRTVKAERRAAMRALTPQARATAYHLYL